MPTETRKILFDIDEIRSALIHYALRTEMKLPKESIEKVQVAPETAAVTFVYGRDPDGEIRKVDFSEQHVAAAIVLYCRTHGFPLPRDAEKLLKSEGQAVAMMIRLVHTDGRPARTGQE